MSQVKLKHRQLENMLYTTEKMLSAAWAQGRMDYPQASLAEVMRDLATAEFHDIIPGSAIQPVEDMALRLIDHGLEILSRLKARAFFSLAQGQPAAPEGEIPILVYNPHPYPVQAVVETEFQLADQNWGSDFTIAQAYQAGQPVPTQMEQELSSLNLDWRKRVVFQAELAPAQMNRFDCRLERLPQRPRPAQSDGDTITFQNAEMEAVINKRTGLIDRYRVAGVDYLNPDAGQMLVIEDSPDPWGMTVNSFRQVIGAFQLLSPEESAWLAGLKTSSFEPVRVIEDGAVRMVVEALFGFHRSHLCLRYKLPKHGSEIEIEARVHWNEKDRMLKLSLPFAGANSHPVGQVAFGAEALVSDGREAVAQKWVVLESADRTLSVVNDRTYGLDFSDNTLRLTLLRSPAYAAHPIYDRPLLPEDRYSPRQDQGERIFHFWLQGGNPADRREKIDREALAHNEIPMALSFFPSGMGETTAPLARLSDPVIQMTAVKKAEDGDGLILRLFEPTGQPRTTTLELPFAGASTEVHLNGFEVRTLHFDLASKQFKAVSLVEAPLP
jgi:alpha-mannosidase